MKSLLLVLALLSGCATGDYARCVLPVTRDAGMGVRVVGCEAWVFEPSLEQKVRAGTLK